MANPVCLSPLKFYDALEKQERYKSYAYGHVSPLVMKLNVLDSFQLIIPDVAGKQDKIIGAYIFDAKTNREPLHINYINGLIKNGLTHSRLHNYTVVTYPGMLPLIDIKFESNYYLKLETNAGIDYYSEVFCFTNSVNEYLEIMYNNPEGYFFTKHGIVDLTTISFIVRLRTELGKPEYGFEEEATKRLGYNFIESQISKKTYKFNAILPEYLCDALRLIRLCSNKTLRSKGEEYEMLSFDMDIDWQDQGDLASANCEFEVDNIIANLGGYSADKLGFGGDFNKDYNADFDNE